MDRNAAHVCYVPGRDSCAAANRISRHIEAMSAVTYITDRRAVITYKDVDALETP